MLHLVPVSGDHGVELPAELYQRWRRPVALEGVVSTPGGGGHANHDYRADAEPNVRGQWSYEHAGIRSC